MLDLKLLLAALTLFNFFACQPVKSSDEKINPVNLAYTCVRVKSTLENDVKSPVLLLHGILGSRNAWNSVNLLIASGTKRRVCAVDLRNHGDSPWNNRSDIDALTVDIGNFLDKEGIQRVNLIGHSLGGKTAMHYALKNPDRVNSVILEDIRPHNVSQGNVFDVLPYFQLLDEAEKSIPVDLTADEAKESLENFLRKKFDELGYKGGDTDKFAEYLEIKLENGKWRYKHNSKVLDDFLKNIKDYWPDSLGVYNGPALFIYGTKSPLNVPEDKDDILRHFPGTTFVPVEGAGHYIHGLYREFDDAVINFLNKIN